MKTGCIIGPTLGQMLVREDGAIVFAVVEDGYYILDRDGNSRKSADYIGDRRWYVLDVFIRFDETGLYFWMEYYNGAMEVINITPFYMRFNMRPER